MNGSIPQVVQNDVPLAIRSAWRMETSVAGF
jgi:hypothetical protein